MKRWKHLVLATALLGAALYAPVPVQAQESAEVRDEMMRQFRSSMRKMVALAEAMPPETFTWSPGEGVMEVGHVYMHIARYNYLYATQSLGRALPPGIEMDTMESVRDKETVVAALEESRIWALEVIGAMSEDELDAETELYGRTVQGWAVLVQLVSHMNEHVGQSIAYARMNGVVPPWSR